MAAWWAHFRPWTRSLTDGATGTSVSCDGLAAGSWPSEAGRVGPGSFKGNGGCRGNSRGRESLPGAQIDNEYDQTSRDVQLQLGCDVEYLKRRSAAHDLRILIKTVPVVLGRKVFFRG